MHESYGQLAKFLMHIHGYSRPRRATSVRLSHVECYKCKQGARSHLHEDCYAEEESGLFPLMLSVLMGGNAIEQASMRASLSDPDPCLTSSDF